MVVPPMVPVPLVAAVLMVRVIPLGIARSPSAPLPRPQTGVWPSGTGDPQVKMPQSLSATQVLPTAQAPQLPPQSTSLSSPFLIPSVQVGAAQTPLAQLAEAQSAVTLQAALGAHFIQAPPQSLSVSLPSRIPSVQVGAMQTPAGQTRPDWQSFPFWHLACAPHLVEHEPPQSMSVSPPFWTLSVQLGVAQSVPPVH